MFELTRDTFLTADTHWSHFNVIRMCGRPADHDKLMLANWKSTVTAGDIVLHLGDLVWTKGGWPHDRIKHLPGKKFLLRGNHDKHSRVDGCGFEQIEASFTATLGEQVILFSHRPTKPSEGGFWHLNIHGHIHNNPYPSWMHDVAADQRHKWLNVSVEMIDYTPRTLGWLLDNHPAPFHNGKGGNVALQGIWPKERDPERTITRA